MCNRLRALDSAVQLGEQAQRPVVIFWNQGAGLVGDLRRLFVLPRQVTHFWMWSSHSRIDRSRHRVRLAVHRLAGGTVYRQMDVDRLLNGEVSVSAWVAQRRLFVRTASRFFSAGRLYAAWKPRDHLQEKVNAFFDRVGERRLIGVHIRRGDQRVSKSLSPTSAFIARMQQVLNDDPEVGFVLATDEPAEAQRLTEAFPGHILRVPQDHYPRSHPAAVETALVELLALAGTEMIIGSAGSSFSETAAEFGGIPLIIATTPS
ncbi:MAG: hypothetical protein H6970_06450 [Gammaproteobacteria bacterium]|nr:hypothetical protein [Gammaproteobacteria bacterium]